MMKRKPLALVLCVLALGTLGLADSLELKNGSLIKGQYLGGTETEISFRVGSSVQHYPVTDVVSLKFDSPRTSQTEAPKPAAPAPAIQSSVAQPSPVAQPSSQAAAPQPALSSRPSQNTVAAPVMSASNTSSSVTIPTGTRLLVRTIDAIDSDTNQVGDKFQASLEEALVVDGNVVAPKGTTVYGRLEQVQSAGQLAGKSELRLSLTGIVVDGKTVALTSGDYSVAGESRSASTAKRVGGGAALGALIGAIAGGGKGAAIGAGVGAGAGTAVQVMTKGEQVHVPSETLLEFTLDQPVTLPISN